MKRNFTRSPVRTTSLAFYLSCSVLAFNPGIAISIGLASPAPQDPARAVPDDPTRIYYTDAQNKLVPLPFESSPTPLDPYVFAKSDKIGYAELRGIKAATTLTVNNLRFYVFVADKMDPPPHQLVRLTTKKATRRFTVVSLKGRKGYSPLAEESIRLEYRILERLLVAAGRNRSLFINYMEIHPRQQLSPGEYAIIGDSLLDIATFRID